MFSGDVIELGDTRSKEIDIKTIPRCDVPSDLALIDS
jgi:hypothetical protein